jgi:hypothetical protein
MRAWADARYRYTTALRGKSREPPNSTAPEPHHRIAFPSKHLSVILHDPQIIFAALGVM